MQADTITIGPNRQWFGASTLIAIGIASAAMVATLPGRTHGLGLITEPLLAELNIDRISFATLNFWATIIGAAFCLPIGWFIDRIGVRTILATVLVCLGIVVIAITWVKAGSLEVSLHFPEILAGLGVETATVPLPLFLLVLLTRGLGQSALSVVSLALIGKVSGEKPGTIVGIYSFLVAIGFMVAFGVVKVAFEQFHSGWRSVFAGMGWILISFGVLSFLFFRNPACESSIDKGTVDSNEISLSLGIALMTPTFWVFALATSFYGLVASGMSLFNQSLLAERGFDRGVFLTITTMAPLIGLAANLVTGWLATRVRLGWLLAAGLLIQASALAFFPAVTSLAQVYTYAAAMGVAGGILTVVFFTVWRQAFGPAQLGQIQGAAQLLTVLASAAGPLVIAGGQRAYGSYSPVVRMLALVTLLFAVMAIFVPLPNKNPTRNDSSI